MESAPTNSYYAIAITANCCYGVALSACEVLLEVVLLSGSSSVVEDSRDQVGFCRFRLPYDTAAVWHLFCWVNM